MLKRSTSNDFTTPRVLRDPTEVEIPRLADDPEYASRDALRAGFSDRLEWLKREKERVELEIYLSGRSADPKSEIDCSLRARLALLTEHAAAAPIASPAPNASSPVIARALAVMAGQPVAPMPDHRAQIADINRQIDLLEAAVMEQREACEESAAEFTLKHARRLKPTWDAVQIEWFNAAVELARVTKRVHELRASITAAGIRSRSDILAMPVVRSPLILGDESFYDSEISGWRRILERLGIL